MTKVKAEIVRCMSALESRERTVTSRFRFPADFVGFQGHFPDNKVLPGVCQIQCALSSLEQAKHRHAALREVVLAKYFAPVAPGEEITCACSDVLDAGEFTFKTMITRGDTKIAELKLRVAFTD